MPYLTTKNFSMYYTDIGQGTPIVFIHPFLLSHDIFDYQQSLQRSYRTIFFDIRGHGRSSSSHHPLTYRLVVQDLICLLDHLKLNHVYLCGYSTGASIALQALIQHPDRFKGAILTSAMSEIATLNVRILMYIAKRLAHPWTQRLFTGMIAGINAESLKTFKKLYQRSIHTDPLKVKEYIESSLTFNCTAQLKQIKHPILIIYGGKDRRFFKNAKLLEQQLPNCQKVIFQGKTHQIPTKAHQQLNKEIARWLQSLESKIFIE